MCLADSFFFCVPLDWGCLVLGCITFDFISDPKTSAKHLDEMILKNGLTVLGAFMGAFTTTLLVLEYAEPGKGIVRIDAFPELVLNTTPANILLTTMTILAALWMLFSVMLLLGIRNNKSSYLLWYFSFGIVLTILCLLSGLLVLVEGHWIVALVKIIMALIYIHCLSVVHTTYDLMQTSTVFKFATRLLSDENILVESTEELRETAN